MSTVVNKIADFINVFGDPKQVKPCSPGGIKMGTPTSTGVIAEASHNTRCDVNNCPSMSQSSCDMSHLPGDINKGELSQCAPCDTNKWENESLEKRKDSINNTMQDCINNAIKDSIKEKKKR